HGSVEEPASDAVLDSRALDPSDLSVACGDGPVLSDCPQVEGLASVAAAHLNYLADVVNYAYRVNAGNLVCDPSNKLAVAAIVRFNRLDPSKDYVRA
ncbi:hypothetical protein, partial [Vibrio vulnificus]|uniref:hypothetical protein n=1 Tax=Vibrio vulnificus TaxID=672 RepID=UPI0013791723